MHKPHLVMIVTGFGGMLALTLMMQHLLSVKTEGKAGGRVAQAFAAQFGRLLEEPPQLVVRTSEDEFTDGVVVTARVKPKPTTEVDRMLAEMGAFLWSAHFEEGEPSSVTIACRDARSDAVSKHRVPPPQRRKAPAPPAPSPAPLPVGR